eukprot:3067568-Alexandrium_andersonii.AAC.1
MVVCTIAAIQGNSGDLRAVRDSEDVGSLRSSRHFASSVHVGIQRSVARCAGSPTVRRRRSLCVPGHHATHGMRNTSWVLWESGGSRRSMQG